MLDFGDSQLFEQFGLTGSRFYALHHIAATPGISPSHLSQLMLCDKSNVTRLLQSLEAEGYVERRSHEFDGRSRRLYLTESGAVLQHRVAAAHNAYVEHRLCGLAHNDQNRLLTSLERLNSALGDELEQPRTPAPSG